MILASIRALMPIESFVQCEREKRTDLYVACGTEETPRHGKLLLHVSS